MSNLNAIEYKSFESIKHLSGDGSEFWYARELATTLGYVQWRNFAKVLDRAELACKNSGYEIHHHFAEVSKTIEMPKSATKQVVDFKLTRYACFLIVQNGDPRKEIIALGQTYFAIKHAGRKLPTILMNSMRTTNALLSGAISNSGTKCLQKQPIMQASLVMKSMQLSRMPDIWAFMVD